MTRIRFEDLPSTNTPRNAENLNKLNNVVISPTEPTTGEEVWIQEGKNLFDKNHYNLYKGYIGEDLTFIENGFAFTVYLKVKPNTTYTISKVATENFKIGTGTEVPATGGKVNSFNDYSNKTSATITTGENDNYLYIYLFWGSDINGFKNILETLQVEQGTATAYEPYIEKKIYTKNDNEVYEEFCNVKVLNDMIPQKINLTINTEYVYLTDLSYYCFKVGKMVIHQ